MLTVSRADFNRPGARVARFPGGGEPEACAELRRLCSLFMVGHRLRGLALPLDVLEKIDFRNAMRIYPRVGDALKRLGYFGSEEAAKEASAS